MNKNLDYYIFHKEKFLDEEYCKNCINKLKNISTWDKHNWYNTGTDSRDRPSGDNEPETLDKDYVREINDVIIQNLHSTIFEYQKKLKYSWFKGWQGYSPIKFIRYFLNQTMITHCDHIHALFDGERKGVPILSIIGILNDDYVGGELIMFEDKKIDIKKGDLLIFPSNFLFPHKIAPITKGVRYSYVSWVW